MTTLRCRTCCASPGTASRCTAARCPAGARMAAFACRSISPQKCSTRRRWGCGYRSSPTTPSRWRSPIRPCSCRRRSRMRSTRRRRSPQRLRATRTMPPRRRPRGRCRAGQACGCRGACGGAQSDGASNPRRCRVRPCREGTRRRQRQPENYRSGQNRGADRGAGRAAEGRRQSAGAECTARHRQGRPESEARCRGRRGSRRQGRRGEARRDRRRRNGREARRRPGVDLHQPCDAEALRAARHAQEISRRRRAVRLQPGVPGRHQGPGRADRHAHLHRGGTRRRRRRRSALDRGFDRQRRQRQGRARPHHLPAPRGARQDRADGSAAVLDHHLGRAAVSETNYRTEFVAV